MIGSKLYQRELVRQYKEGTKQNNTGTELQMTGAKWRNK
jgi:hypothetical protein